MANLLIAVQGIAVDSWCSVLLPKETVSYASVALTGG